MGCNALAYFRESSRWCIVGITIAQGSYSSFNNMGWSFEIGFSNFQMDHVPTLRLQFFGAGQYFKSAFTPQTVHSARKLHFLIFSCKMLPMWWWLVWSVTGFVARRSPDITVVFAASKCPACCFYVPNPSQDPGWR
jgi:hypothetical protein